MRAANRQTRDTIALLIRCFSARSSFLNAKIIENVANDEENLDEEEDTYGPRVYSVSDVLIELE